MKRILIGNGTWFDRDEATVIWEECAYAPGIGLRVYRTRKGAWVLQFGTEFTPASLSRVVLALMERGVNVSGLDPDIAAAAIDMEV